MESDIFLVNLLLKALAFLQQKF